MPGACGPWSTPELVPGIGATGLRGGTIAPDGLSLVALDFSGGGGGGDGLYATRLSRTQPFSTPAAILGSAGNLWDTAPLFGGQFLLYAVAGTSGCPSEVSSLDRYDYSGQVARTATTGCTPVMNGTFLLEDGRTAYSTNDAGQLQVSTRASVADVFSGATVRSEITVPVAYPAVRGDELELYFENFTRGTLDIYVSTRARTTDPWGPPALVALATDTFNEDDASITADGTELYFSSDSTGVYEMYRVTRTCD